MSTVSNGFEHSFGKETGTVPRMVLAHVDIRNHLAHSKKSIDPNSFTFTSQILCNHRWDSIYKYLYPQAKTSKIGVQWEKKCETEL
jgi:hypothetical protein